MLISPLGVRKNYQNNYNPIEGFIGMRSSPCCKTVDTFELYGTQLAQKVFLFNETEYSIAFNPLSGTVVNQIVYNAILGPKTLFLAWYSQHFCKVMKMGGLDVYTDGTDTHLSIIKFYYPVSVMQKRVQQHGISPNTCYLPGEITPQGLRFGFLIIAFLKINENDFNTICDLILNILTGKYMINNYKTVSQIIKKYEIKLQLYFN